MKSSRAKQKNSQEEEKRFFFLLYGLASLPALYFQNDLPIFSAILLPAGVVHSPPQPVHRSSLGLSLIPILSYNGALYVKVERTGNDTTLSQIIRFVEDAQGKKAPVSKLADRIAGVFVPVVIGIAIAASVLSVSYTHLDVYKRQRFPQQNPVRAGSSPNGLPT